MLREKLMEKPFQLSLGNSVVHRAADTNLFSS